MFLLRIQADEPKQDCDGEYKRWDESQPGGYEALLAYTAAPSSPASALRIT
jgi:hypothetical protein